MVLIVAGAAVLLGDGVGRSARQAPTRVRPAFDVPVLIEQHQPRGHISNLYGGAGIDRNSRAASDREGHWILAWHSSQKDGSGGSGDWDILVARSGDGGKSWNEPKPVAANAASDRGDDLSPTVATDGAGNWLIAWSSNETFDGTLGPDRDILFVRSIDGGETWSRPVPLNVNASEDWGDDFDVRVACDGAGHWVAVWASTDSLVNRIGGDSDLLVARSSDQGATWTQPMPLNTNAAKDGAFDTTPDLASDGQGRWLAAWSSGASKGSSYGPDRDILIARSDDQGATWSDPAPLNSNAASDHNSDWTPALATDGRGNWIAVWTSADSLEDAIGADRDVLVSRSSDNGLTWTAAAALSRAAPRDAREDSSPAIATDRYGNWVVVWHAWGALGYDDGSDADIVASYSRDNGKTWMPPISVNPDSAGDVVDDLLPTVMTDGTGHWLVVWQGFYPFADHAKRHAMWRVVASAGSITGLDVGPPAPSAP